MLFNCTKYLEWARSFTLISGGRADGITTTIVTKNSIFGNFVGLRRYLLLCPVIMVSFGKNFCEIIRSSQFEIFFTNSLKNKICVFFFDFYFFVKLLLWFVYFHEKRQFYEADKNA